MQPWRTDVTWRAGRLGFLLMLMLSSSRVLAEDEAVLVEAREAFRLGSQLTKHGQWAEALAAYERSAKLHAHATTTYNMAYCERALDHATRARKLFRQALEENDTRGGELTPGLVSRAEAFLKELDGKMARAVIELAAPTMAIAVDGRPLERESAALWIAGTRHAGDAESTGVQRFSVLLDPGDHVFVVTLRGREQTRVRRFAAGEQTRLALGAELVPEPPRERRMSSERTAAIVAWGLSGGATIAGIVAGSMALDRKNTLDGVCANRGCPEDRAGDIETMQDASLIATSAFVVAGAGLVLGTVLFVIGAPEDEAETTARIVFLPTGAELDVSF